MKKIFSIIFLTALAVGLMGSCKKDSSPKTSDLPDEALPDGAFPEEFSVSADKKVLFSNGNLFWDGSAFRFEVYRQWYSSGKASWVTAHISHFYWSKDASVAYAETYSDAGVTAGDVFFTNTDGFKVVNASEEYTGWRTLSADEWNYLFNIRTVNGGTGKDKSFSLGINYGGMMGLVLYPDNYSGNPISGNVDNLPEGVVFLASMGERNGSTISSARECGYYWSSTASLSTTVFGLEFDDSNLWIGSNFGRSGGYCIRLVIDINEK